MARGFNYAPGASAEIQEAMQPGLHKTHIAALGVSRNNLVRAAVAARPDCPLGLMVTLAHDYSAEVRANVASNPTAQRTVMAYLATDRSVDVLKALLANPSLPADVVDELAFHKKSEVRAAAAARLDAPPVAVAAPTAEDVHNPELAEHVAPMQARMTADGTMVSSFAPVNVVDIVTGSPIAAYPSPTTPVGAYAAPLSPSATPSAPVAEPVIPQIFAPHSAPGAPAPTRTAPVRGFKPKP